MSDSLDDVFEVLEPPPGGLTRLRARLDEPAARGWAPLVAGLALAAAAALLVVPAPGPEPLTTDPVVLALLGEPVAADAVTLVSGHAALREVSVDEQVVFYELAKIP